MAKRKTKRAGKVTVRKPSAAEELRMVQAVRQRNQRNAILLFAFAILMGCFVLIPGDNVWLRCHDVLLGLFGSCAILWPLLLIYIAVVTSLEKQVDHPAARLSLMGLVILLFCAEFYVFTVPSPVSMSAYRNSLILLYGTSSLHSSAGLCGGLIGIPLSSALGILGARITISLALFAALMILTRTTLIQLFKAIAKPADVVATNISSAHERRIEQNRRASNIDIPLDGDSEMPPHPVHSPLPGAEKTEKPEKPKKNEKLEYLKRVFSSGGSPAEQPATAPAAPSAAPSPAAGAKPAAPAPEPAAVPASSAAPAAGNPFLQKAPPEPRAAEPAAAAKAVSEKPSVPAPEPPADGSYHMPPISMLEATREGSEEDIAGEIATTGRMLVDTLNSFGVQTTYVGYSRGPAVTRYELQPAAGVKISRITSLADDISMNLAAAGIRIEAPIPGKNAVGIEVPNKNNTIVRMRDLVRSNSFSASKSKLTVALGRDIAGEIAVADLAKMPHLLIAGATGSGKSVCINAMIISMLYKSKPQEVRFLMIDPKVVELGIYNGIPQLLVPVVTDPRKAAGALSWAVAEMLKRYKTFAEKGVRDLKAYNDLVSSQEIPDESGKPLEKMPQIVIIIDELADLMMAAPSEVEDSICRLAQMARAAGMHLVIATQRPSVDVITGIIKANIPSRIAFSVSSQVDSRTILDMGGAEKLLGHGDMLFSPVGSQKPKRIQGCFVSDSEIESVVGFIKKSQEADYSDSIAEEIERNAASDDKGHGDDPNLSGEDADPMMQDAIKFVVEAGQASTSMLQRRFRLGYARAGRLVDQMEQMGIVSAQDGSKPRQVLITYQQWLERNMQTSDAPKEENGSKEEN